MFIMKRLVTLMCCFVCSILLFSQNLVPNPSFEDVNICKKYHEPCAPKAWRATVLKNFYYWEYLAIQNKSIPPVEGTRSIGFTMYLAGKDYARKFVQTPLLCELKKDKKYELTLHYLIKECTIGEFGIYFTDTLKIYRNNDPMKKIEPQIRITIPENTEYGKWIEVKATYTAKGGERGLIIGNFNTDENTKLLSAKDVRKKDFEQSKKRRIYTRFDEFSLTPIDPNAHEDCPIELNLNQLYRDSVKHLYEEIILVKDWEDIEPEISEIPEETAPLPFNEPQKIIIAQDTITTGESFTIPNINFETNSAQLLPSSFRSLDRIRMILRSNPQFNLKIIGHTDDIGNEEENLVLSQKRAESVARFLINNGISSYRIETDGKGESEPITKNRSEINRFLNRRVEFILINNDL